MRGRIFISVNHDNLDSLSYTKWESKVKCRHERWLSTFNEPCHVEKQNKSKKVFWHLTTINVSTNIQTNVRLRRILTEDPFSSHWIFTDENIISDEKFILPALGILTFLRKKIKFLDQRFLQSLLLTK